MSMWHSVGDYHDPIDVATSYQGFRIGVMENLWDEEVYLNKEQFVHLMDVMQKALVKYEDWFE